MSKWQTIDGKSIDFTSLSDQHLRNIYWYHTLVAPSITQRIIARSELNRRAAAKVLRTSSYKTSPSERVTVPYVPFYDYEIKDLHSKGLIIGEDIYDKIGGFVIGHLPTGLSKILTEIKEEINRESKSKDSNL